MPSSLIQSTHAAFLANAEYHFESSLQMPLILNVSHCFLQQLCILLAMCHYSFKGKDLDGPHLTLTLASSFRTH
eukprot:scaffold6776_cov99-Skeletonema_dohrnii-CCMP3373.AAC.15